jgi:hypothetical protein
MGATITVTCNPTTPRMSVIGQDPHWWEGDLDLTVDRNPAYVGSMGEAMATVCGSCGSDPAPRVAPSPVRTTADKDPTAPRVKAPRASVDPQSFDRWILAVG